MTIEGEALFGTQRSNFFLIGKLLNGFKVQSAYLFSYDFLFIVAFQNVLLPKDLNRGDECEEYHKLLRRESNGKAHNGKQSEEDEIFKNNDEREWILRMEQNQIYCYSFTLLLYFSSAPFV
jgi:hypothetical protein